MVRYDAAIPPALGQRAKRLRFVSLTDRGRSNSGFVARRARQRSTARPRATRRDPSPSRAGRSSFPRLLPGAIDGALRAGIDPEAVVSAFVRSYDANLLTAVRSAAVADELGHDTDEAWVAAALEPRRTHHEGVAKRLGIPKKQARNLDSPTVTVKPSQITIVAAAIGVSARSGNSAPRH